MLDIMITLIITQNNHSLFLEVRELKILKTNRFLNSAISLKISNILYTLLFIYIYNLVL